MVFFAKLITLILTHVCIGFTNLSAGTVEDNTVLQHELINLQLLSLRKDVNRVSSKLSHVLAALKSLPKTDGYIGCFFDDGSRHLKHKGMFFTPDNSLEKCKEHCKGFTYLGLQASVYCCCGNELENKKYPRVADSECNLKCSGESNRKCGGSWRNSVYLV